MTVRFRRSTGADVPALLDLWRRSVAATHDFLSPADFAEIERLVADEYLPNAEFLLAVDEQDVPIGFLDGSHDSIEALFVDPSRHRQGIGRELLEEFARTAKGKLGVEVNEQNHGARRFYEQCGFKAVGRSPLDRDGRPYPLLIMAR